MHLYMYAQCIASPSSCLCEYDLRVDHSALDNQQGSSNYSQRPQT